MLEKNTLIKVTNRSAGVVFYDIPDLNLSRHYEPNETKEVSMEEILKLSYTLGGKRILEKYLVLDNKEAVNEILGEVEPEYFYSKDDVIKLLQVGTLAQVEDCLNYADEGVIDLVKTYAVDLEINDVAKRELIQKKTGFNVNKAIEIKHITEEDNVETEAPTHRLAAPINAEAPVKETGRKAAPINAAEETKTSKYNVTKRLD